MIQEHSEHETVRKGLNYCKKKQKIKAAEKPENTSIWKYFSQDQLNLYAKCQLCPCKVFEIKDGVVEELSNHMYTKHPDELTVTDK